jgi:hypothetical protein
VALMSESVRAQQRRKNNMKVIPANADRIDVCVYASSCAHVRQSILLHYCAGPFVMHSAWPSGCKQEALAPQLLMEAK